MQQYATVTVWYSMSTNNMKETYEQIVKNKDVNTLFKIRYRYYNSVYNLYTTPTSTQS